MKRKIVFLNLLVLFLAGHSTFAQYVPKDKRERKNKTVQDSTQKVDQQKKEKVKKERSSDLSEQSFGQRLTFGGNLGLAFGNPTSIDLSPRLGYRFTEKFIAGLGANYIYYNLDFNFSNGGGGSIESSFYGGRVYGQYFVIPQAFAWVELEAMNVDFFNDANDRVEREWQLAPLLGAGFFQSFGGRGGIAFAVLYNLNHQDGRSYRNTPWVTRIGFNF